VLALSLALLLGAAPPPVVLRFSPRPNRAAEVHWRAFSPEAFAEATHDGKPVFLNLAAVWCHWCHVFDETTLSNPEVIALLNERFVPMRVDADQNPQVERRYLMGGWPTNAFLEGDGQPLGGGTYFPPDRFLLIARAVVEGYRGDHAVLRQRLGDLDLPAPEGPHPGALSGEVAGRIGGELMGILDAEHGGFGIGTKFPEGAAVSLLAYLGRTRGDRRAGRAAATTLEQMARGEIVDKVEGGIYRYALNPDWSSPHYEKMLATNAETLLAASEAYAATHDEALRQLATSIASYLVTHLWDASAGGFDASQDADEAYSHRDAAGRAALPGPFIDRTFLADHEALAARALLRAAVVLGEPDLARYGLQAVDLLATRMRAPSGLAFHTLAATAGARPSLEGPLVDQAQLLLALLDAAAWSGEERYLTAAEALVAAIERELGDRATPGFFDAPAHSLGPGLTSTREKHLEDNALLAWGLLRLEAVAPDPLLRARGEATLAAFAGRASGLRAVTFARAADLAQGQCLRLVVVGAPREPGANALFAAARTIDDPRRELRRLPSTPQGARLGELRFPAGPAAVYACFGTACSTPLRDPATLAEQVATFAATHGPPPR
jgi:uncharacterized protein YyaL (SSP411 family)